jgi:hypothetical protein
MGMTGMGMGIRDWGWGMGDGGWGWGWGWEQEREQEREHKLLAIFCTTVFMSQILYIPCERHGDVHVAIKKYLRGVKSKNV